MAAKVYVSEFVSTKPVGVGTAMLQAPSVAEQQIVTSATSGASAAFNAKTKIVRVHTDGIVSVKFGSAPTALVTDHRMAANTTEYFAVEPGHKIAAIDNT